MYLANTLDARYSDFIVFLSATALLSFTNLTHDGIATSSNIPSNDVTGIQLGAPFYEEHYSVELGMPKTSNRSFTGNFTGEGILNGDLSVSAEGNVTGTLRDNDTVFLHGVAEFITENEDTAVYSFDAFTDYNPDGSSEGSGTAIFDEGTTGELSFLSNTLAVYKNRVDSSGNGTFLMWHWK